MQVPKGRGSVCHSWWLLGLQLPTPALVPHLLRRIICMVKKNVFFPYLSKSPDSRQCAEKPGDNANVFDESFTNQSLYVMKACVNKARFLLLKQGLT